MKNLTKDFEIEMISVSPAQTKEQTRRYCASVEDILLTRDSRFVVFPFPDDGSNVDIILRYCRRGFFSLTYVFSPSLFYLFSRVFFIILYKRHFCLVTPSRKRCDEIIRPARGACVFFGDVPFASAKYSRFFDNCTSEADFASRRADLEGEVSSGSASPAMPQDSEVVVSLASPSAAASSADRSSRRKATRNVPVGFYAETNASSGELIHIFKNEFDPVAPEATEAIPEDDREFGEYGKSSGRYVHIKLVSLWKKEDEVKSQEEQEMERYDKLQGDGGKEDAPSKYPSGTCRHMAVLRIGLVGYRIEPESAIGQGSFGMTGESPTTKVRLHWDQHEDTPIAPLRKKGLLRQPSMSPFEWMAYLDRAADFVEMVRQRKRERKLRGLDPLSSLSSLTGGEDPSLRRGGRVIGKKKTEYPPELDYLHVPRHVCVVFVSPFRAEEELPAVHAVADIGHLNRDFVFVVIYHPRMYDWGFFAKWDSIVDGTADPAKRTEELRKRHLQSKGSLFHMKSHLRSFSKMESGAGDGLFQSDANIAEAKQSDGTWRTVFDNVAAEEKHAKSIVVVRKIKEVENEELVKRQRKKRNKQQMRRMTTRGGKRASIMGLTKDSWQQGGMLDPTQLEGAEGEEMSEIDEDGDLLDEEEKDESEDRLDDLYPYSFFVFPNSNPLTQDKLIEYLHLYKQGLAPRGMNLEDELEVYREFFEEHRSIMDFLEDYTDSDGDGGGGGGDGDDGDEEEGEVKKAPKPPVVPPPIRIPPGPDHPMAQQQQEEDTPTRKTFVDEGTVFEDSEEEGEVVVEIVDLALDVEGEGEVEYVYVEEGEEEIDLDEDPGPVIVEGFDGTPATGGFELMTQLLTGTQKLHEDKLRTMGVSSLYSPDEKLAHLDEPPFASEKLIRRESTRFYSSSYWFAVIKAFLYTIVHAFRSRWFLFEIFLLFVKMSPITIVTMLIVVFVDLLSTFLLSNYFCIWCCVKKRPNFDSVFEYILGWENHFEKFWFKALKLLTLCAVVACGLGLHIGYFKQAFVTDDFTCRMTSLTSNDTTPYEQNYAFHDIPKLLYFDSCFNPIVDVTNCSATNEFNMEFIEYYKGMALGIVNLIIILFAIYLYDGPACDHYVTGLEKLRNRKVPFPRLNVTLGTALTKDTETILAEVIAGLFLLRSRDEPRLSSRLEHDESISHADLSYFEGLTAFDVGFLQYFFIDSLERRRDLKNASVEDEDTCGAKCVGSMKATADTLGLSCNSSMCMVISCEVVGLLLLFVFFFFLEVFILVCKFMLFPKAQFGWFQWTKNVIMSRLMGYGIIMAVCTGLCVYALIVMILNGKDFHNLVKFHVNDNYVSEQFKLRWDHAAQPSITLPSATRTKLLAKRKKSHALLETFSKRVRAVTDFSSCASFCSYLGEYMRGGLCTGVCEVFLLLVVGGIVTVVVVAFYVVGIPLIILFFAFGLFIGFILCLCALCDKRENWREQMTCSDQKECWQAVVFSCFVCPLFLPLSCVKACSDNIFSVCIYRCCKVSIDDRHNDMDYRLAARLVAYNYVCVAGYQKQIRLRYGVKKHKVKEKENVAREIRLTRLEKDRLLEEVLDHNYRLRLFHSGLQIKENIDRSQYKRVLDIETDDPEYARFEELSEPWVEKQIMSTARGQYALGHWFCQVMSEDDWEEEDLLGGGGLLAAAAAAAGGTSQRPPAAAGPPPSGGAGGNASVVTPPADSRSSRRVGKKDSE